MIVLAVMGIIKEYVVTLFRLFKNVFYRTATDLNLQPLSLSTNTQPFSKNGQFL